MKNLGQKILHLSNKLHLYLQGKRQILQPQETSEARRDKIKKS